MLAGDDDPDDIIRSVRARALRGQLRRRPGRHHERQVRLLGQRGLPDRGRPRDPPVKGATLIGNGPDVAHPGHRGRPRSQARRGRRHLRQGRPVRAGRRRAADDPHRRHDRRRDAGLSRRAMRRSCSPLSCSTRPARGATAADAFVVEDQSFSAQVRLGAGGHGQARPRAAHGAAGLRGQVGGGRLDLGSLARRPGPPGRRGGVARAGHRPDALPGLPDAALLAREIPDLDLYDDPRGHDLSPEDEDRPGPALRGGRARGGSAHHQLRGRRLRRPPRALRLRHQPRLRGRATPRSSFSSRGVARWPRATAQMQRDYVVLTRPAVAPVSTIPRRSAASRRSARYAASAPAG